MAASTSTNAGRLDHETSEEEFAALVDRARRELDRQLLLELLPERIPVYQGRSANTVTRMRGYLLAAFEEAGLPEGALPYVLEELESGRNAYLVAAAARALRGRESRSSDAVPFLLKAIANIAYADDAVSFDSYRPSWPLSGHTTALQEICATVACLGSEATVALPALRSLLQQPGVLLDPTRIKLESADPESDLPARLRAYGENRGVVFSPSDRLFRTRGELAALDRYFELGVSFGGTLVNRHRIELFLLDQRCRVAVAFTRLQWDVEDVLAQATSLAERA